MVPAYVSAGSRLSVRAWLAKGTLGTKKAHAVQPSLIGAGHALSNSNTEQHWGGIVKRTPDGADYLIPAPVVPAAQVRDQPRSLMLKYGDRKANRSNDENLRQAIKSTLVYYM